MLPLPRCKKCPTHPLSPVRDYLPNWSADPLQKELNGIKGMRMLVVANHVRITYMRFACQQ